MKNRLVKKSQGFTLIELLVVIAIISVLSSVVLGSLQVARTKAKSVVMKQNMHVLITNVQQYINENGSTLNICNPSSLIIDNLSKIAANFGGGTPNDVGGPYAGLYYKCDSTLSGSYLLQIKTSDTEFYCLDSTGGALTLKLEGTACIIN